MSKSDSLSDMLTRIRNAQSAGKATTLVPRSKLHEGVLDVLKRAGYIEGYLKIDSKEDAHVFFDVKLRYVEGFPAIVKLDRVSKPGRRVYTSIKSLPRVSNGLGISILSTSNGVVSDHEARDKNVGGEILCSVF